MKTILIVDDDKNILKVIKMKLESEGFQVASALKAQTALQIAKDEVIDLALLDLKLNGKNGIKLMGDLHQINPELPVIILTAYGAIDTAVEAMRKGAYSYLTKPFDDNDLLLQIEQCLEKTTISCEVKNLNNIVKEKYGVDNIIGQNGKMKKVMAKISQAAATDSIVHIEGDSGTGKELIAKTLHAASSRRDGPFVGINCAAIPENLMESELFGFEKGAFTGALKRKKGFFAQAAGGSIFLDEISEMPFPMQAKLLRVIEEREYYPLGSEKTVKVDTRIIIASNKDLAKEVENKTFREDLYYRIHVIPIKLPPLKDRKESIPLLSKHFLEKYSSKISKDINGFSKSAMQKLLLHTWPGNVRELENTIECAVALTTKNIIQEDLILQSRNIKTSDMKPLKAAKEDFEKNYIIQLFEFTKGNVSKAAKLAGRYRADLYDLLKKYDMKPADFR
ncbi:MAG: sigma-54-dependent Fis family transcriptional regulator [Deltaproteobacteria bacterium]|nr:sigma-54-dependent Fis family transcriptional regulator [Deltaproteobacteria bacterium]